MCSTSQTRHPLAAARTVVASLAEKGHTLAVAESLTGGEVCARLVDVPGASKVIRGAVVAYATELKHSILGVDASLQRDGGPVQAEVATQMAVGVARVCGADLGASTTGVAGPGDSPDGPEGLVYIAVSDPLGHLQLVKELRLCGSRWEIRQQTVDALLELLAEAAQ